ncbi:MAG: peptidylprolyl isomerase [Acidobacteriota bacterium]|nr:MAG: peptidylprolyl isomerase [Acidobacteriota bacterium]
MHLTVKSVHLDQRFVRLLGCFLTILTLLFAGCSGTGDGPENLEYTDEPGMETVAVLETSRGAITIGFLAEDAPEHVRNFIRLCGTGFYDGTMFHRVAPGYLIQGGDPLSRDDDPENDGTGGYSHNGPGTSLEPEFNGRHHSRGTVSMARSGSPDSAGSQFFIMLTADSELDGKYTAFGEVREGMEVVEEIAQQPGNAVNDVGGVMPRKPQVIEQCRIENRPVQTSTAAGSDPQ